MAAGSALSLIQAVLELVAERRTGMLEVRAGGVRTQIWFDDGKPLFAEDAAPGESFGRLLMRQGVISNEQFVRVIDEMTRAATGNNQLRFGDVAVGLGVLTAEQVERGLAEQVCGIITRALQRGESQWDFTPSPAARLPPRSFSLAIAPTVLEALVQSGDRAKIAEAIAAHPEDLVLVAGSQPAPGGDARGAGDDRHATRMSAEQAFQKGMALLREAKAASAAVELRRASDLQPESLEYQLYATWAKARSYRDVPIESDQQALLDIAQRAKKRDPLFAFASYVIGQVSMWAGDDAAAKKWFYEALRIDPSSEAGAQVRILARRGGALPAAADAPTAEAAAPVREAPPPVVDEAPPAPETEAEPPSQAPVASSPPPAPSSRRTGWAVPGITVFAVAAMAILAVARQSLLDGAPVPPVPQPSVVVDAAAPVAAEGADTVAAPVAEKEPKAMREKDAEDADAGSGTVLMPSRAAGHRIFVDGRRSKTEGNEPLLLRCGPHAIQIGSGGAPEPIDVPCGGEVQLQ